MIRVHFTEFIETTQRLPNRPRLADMILHEGYVHLEEAVWERYKAEASGVPEEENPESKKRYYTASKRDHFPPCIQLLVDGIRKGANLSHMQRFTLATYLLRVNVSRESIEALFSNAPNFKANTTRSQLDQITREDYAAPNCATIAKAGACVPNDLCLKTRPDGSRMVSNPLHFTGLMLGREKKE